LSTERQYNLVRDAEGWLTATATVINSTVGPVHTVSIDIPAVAGFVTQLGGFFLTQTTGSGGGTPTVKVVAGAFVLDQDTFVVGTPKRVPYTIPLPGVAGTTLSIRANAADITAANLTAIYRRIPL